MTLSASPATGPASPLQTCKDFAGKPISPFPDQYAQADVLYILYKSRSRRSRRIMTTPLRDTYAALVPLLRATGSAKGRESVGGSHKHVQVLCTEHVIVVLRQGDGLRGSMQMIGHKPYVAHFDGLRSSPQGFRGRTNKVGHRKAVSWLPTPPVLHYSELLDRTARSISSIHWCLRRQLFGLMGCHLLEDFQCIIAVLEQVAHLLTVHLDGAQQQLT